METKKCKYCQEEIAKKAKRCPKCGGKFGIPIIIKILIVIAIIFICVVGCMASCSKSVSDEFSKYDDNNGKTTFSVGEIFESKHMKITFKSFNPNFLNYNEYLGPADGNKVVEFSFYAENIGDEDEDFSYWSFNCYADSVAKNQFYLAEDQELFNSFSAGKSADLKVYCEVPKDSLKVSVEYKPVLAEKNYEFIAN